MMNNAIIFYPKMIIEKHCSDFFALTRPFQCQINIDSIVFSPKELLESLDRIAEGLEERFTTQLRVNFVAALSRDDFNEVIMEELEHVVRLLPGTAPGPDGITSGMLKILFDLNPQDLTNIINYSLRNAWIPADWKIAKIIPLLKKTKSGQAYRQYKAHSTNFECYEINRKDTAQEGYRANSPSQELHG